MATEKRLIDASELSRIYKKWIPQLILPQDQKDKEAIETCIKVLEDQPTVDAVEVVHGRWEPREDAIGFVRCSVCHDCNIYDDWPDDKKWNYCPHCGAKMDGDANA